MRNALPIGIRPRSTLTVDTRIQHLHIPFHDADSAATVAYSGYIAGASVAGTLALAGTSEAFDGTGDFEPGLGSGSADNYVLTSADWNNFFTPAGLTGTAMLVFLVSMRFPTSNPQEYVLAVNRNISASPGGYAINIQSGQFQLNTRAASASGAVQTKKSSLDVDVWHSGICIIDGFTSTQRTGVDGSLAAAESADLFANGGTDFTAMTASFGPAVIGAVAATGPTYGVLWNDGASETSALRNLRVLRIPFAPSETWLAKLFSEYHATPREPLPTMARVT